ncbi:CBS domain-containing protein [Parageobacillus thermantarcticus]|uniref:CBS domain-containing protein n=1 Tax=Parageobacillus thermantarcticus TaxID=186116 RepID=A0A1I0TKQ4_9BACL|nr:CBS domain-containing protein [Parageobacillus thermantarcticus]SFA51576.1 CBS domain-containing protein [Parageobacillus thermantarcticus]
MNNNNSNKVQDIMTKNVATVSPNQTVQEAAQIMSQKNIGALPVVENGQVKGMITDRDITLRTSAQGKNPASTSVSEVMTNRVVTGTPNMSVQEAANVMAQNQVRRLPIVENNQLQGIVALGDIATNSASDQAAEQALTNISEPSQPQG